MREAAFYLSLFPETAAGRTYRPAPPVPEEEQQALIEATDAGMLPEPRQQDMEGLRPYIMPFCESDGFCVAVP